MTHSVPHSALVLRHIPEEPLGLLGDSLRRFHLPYCFADLPATPNLPLDLNAHSALIVLGGPQSVNSPLDFLDRERLLIEQALRRDMPLLAICLGAQLLAATLGAPVYPAPRPEIGFLSVSPTLAASDDPLFADFAPQPVFQWHSETFDLPAGAALLATGADCPHQAFRCQNAWGLQFHLEITPSTIAQWLREDEMCGEAREARLPIDPHQHEQELKALAPKVFDPWVRLVVG